MSLAQLKCLVVNLFPFVPFNKENKMSTLVQYVYRVKHRDGKVVYQKDITVPSTGEGQFFKPVYERVGAFYAFKDHTGHIAVGVSKKHRNDTFDRDTGLKLAMGSALQSLETNSVHIPHGFEQEAAEFYDRIIRYFKITPLDIVTFELASNLTVADWDAMIANVRFEIEKRKAEKLASQAEVAAGK